MVSNHSCHGYGFELKINKANLAHLPQRFETVPCAFMMSNFCNRIERRHTITIISTKVFPYFSYIAYFTVGSDNVGNYPGVLAGSPFPKCDGGHADIEPYGSWDRCIKFWVRISPTLTPYFPLVIILDTLLFTRYFLHFMTLSTAYSTLTTPTSMDLNLWIFRFIYFYYS